MTSAINTIRLIVHKTMTLLPFHPFASFFDHSLDDTFFLSGKNNASAWGQPPLGLRLQHESDEAFVYAIDAPEIQSDHKWRLSLDRTKQETVIRLKVNQEGVSEKRRLFSVGSNVDAERISAKLSDHILTITVPKKHRR